MGISTVFLRPYNLVRHDKQFRAASQHTSNWGLERLLSAPATRETALTNALGREKLSPALAIAIVAGDFPAESKAAVVRNVSAHLDLTRVLPEAGEMAPVPLAHCHYLVPKFFRLLAAQPDEVVRSVHDLWSASHEAPPPPTNYTRGKAVFQLEKEQTFLLHCGAELIIRTYRSPLDKLPFFKDLVIYDRDHHVIGCRISGLVFNF